jgi:DNA polymerase
MLRPTTGTLIAGRYELENRIGEGGFGEVWSATDVRLAPRRVAVKFIKQVDPQPELIRRFQAEGRALCVLNHPGIVSIIDQGEEDAIHYLVTEYLAGEPLSTWIEDHRVRGAWPDSGKVLSIFDQVAAALDAAHRNSDPGPIVHRDLKPGNIFLVRGSQPEDVHAKVLDFGLAQLGGRQLTPSGAVFGTPVYMAPEQALGEVDVISPATDVFALAVVLIEMLTLEMQSPSEAPWWLEVLRTHTGSPESLNPLPPNLPGRLREVVARGLSTRPQDRFRTAGDFRAAVAEACSIGGPLHRPSIALGRLDRLHLLESEVKACVSCRLGQSRQRVAFGRGGLRTDVMFSGEAPGTEEDNTSIPFSSPAGQLLDRMIAAMGLSPDQVYLTNVIKCKTPGCRSPEPDEIVACRNYWEQQVELVNPRILVTLGRVASQTVLRSSQPISRLRGRWGEYCGIPTMPTLHPAFLLRSPDAKRDSWEDLKCVRDRLESRA